VAGCAGRDVKFTRPTWSRASSGLEVSNQSLASNAKQVILPTC